MLHEVEFAVGYAAHGSSASQLGTTHDGLGLAAAAPPLLLLEPDDEKPPLPDVDDPPPLLEPDDEPLLDPEDEPPDCACVQAFPVIAMQTCACCVPPNDPRCLTVAVTVCALASSA